MLESESEEEDAPNYYSRRTREKKTPRLFGVHIQWRGINVYDMGEYTKSDCKLTL